MINLFTLKTKLIAYAAGALALALAVFHIRKGGADAQKQKHTQTTLENVAQATVAKNTTVELLNNPDERKRLRAKWRKTR